MRTSCWLSGHYRGTGQPANDMFDVVFVMARNGTIEKAFVTLDEVAVARLRGSPASVIPAPLLGAPQMSIGGEFERQSAEATMLTLLVAFALAFQSTASDPLLSRLVGAWSGEGTVLGQPARVRMEWAPTLDGAFVRLTFVNEMGTSDKKRTFEGHAYYRATAAGTYRGTWMDNSGAIRPIEASGTGDALVARWGTPETEEGETTYRLISATTMEVVDRVKSKDGSWREFGRVTLSR